MPDSPTFFATGADFRDWLAAHHTDAPELIAGFWKTGTGKPSVTWPEARDQALCFGWIDGVRTSLGADSYKIRFTPRRPGSIWSKVNIARFAALRAAGLMTPAGERAFAEGKENSGHYSYENETRALSEAEEAEFRANAGAWADFEKRPPSYRKVALYWVTSAKKPETRAKRLAILIADSAAGRKLGVVEIARKKA